MFVNCVVGTGKADDVRIWIWVMSEIYVRYMTETEMPRLVAKINAES